MKHQVSCPVVTSVIIVSANLLIIKLRDFFNHYALHVQWHLKQNPIIIYNGLYDQRIPCLQGCLHG